jgi:hypothetical protein
MPSRTLRFAGNARLLLELVLTDGRWPTKVESYAQGVHPMCRQRRTCPARIRLQCLKTRSVTAATAAFAVAEHDDQAPCTLHPAPCTVHFSRSMASTLQSPGSASGKPGIPKSEAEMEGVMAPTHVSYGRGIDAFPFSWKKTAH